jgi:hypothetical protein
VSYIYLAGQQDTLTFAPNVFYASCDEQEVMSRAREYLDSLPSGSRVVVHRIELNTQNPQKAMIFQGLK